MAQDKGMLIAVEDGIATLTLNRPDAGNGWIGAKRQRHFELLE